MRARANAVVCTKPGCCLESVYQLHATPCMSMGTGLCEGHIKLIGLLQVLMTSSTGLNRVSEVPQWLRLKVWCKVTYHVAAYWYVSAPKQPLDLAKYKWR